ncbi:MAG: RND family efflux transporter MFP subunit [Arenicella sp.]|jgi:RND family efflux transporter MFP subunit
MQNQKRMLVLEEMLEELAEAKPQNNQQATNQSEFEVIDFVVDKTERSLNKTNIGMGIGTLLLIALALAAYALDWFSPAGLANPEPKGPPPAQVVTASARTMTMSPHTTLPGTVVSMLDAVIASETSGKIISIVQIGEVVEAGDSLAEIDPQNAQQLVAQRQAELDRLQSLYTYHSDYFTRVGGQNNDLGIPEITIAELRSNVETSKAEVARAKVALVSAQTDLARTSIKAPFAGRVVSQSIQPGEFAQIGSPIARVVDTQNLEISARVPAALVQPIEPGTELKIIGRGRELTAPLRALVPVGDAVSRTMELRVSLSNTDLLVGSPVRVSLPTAASKEVIAIPRDAIILRPNQQYVFVVEEGVANRKEVQLGYGEGDMIEVIGDIKGNATVVIRGGERLRDGQSVVWNQGSEVAGG